MEHHARSIPNNTYFRWIDENGDETSWSFLQFRDAVVKRASWLFHEKNLSKGDRVVLCLLPGYDFTVSVLACMYLGAVPVPCFPFNPFDRSSHFSKKANHIIAATKPKFILADRN